VKGYLSAIIMSVMLFASQTSVFADESDLTGGGRTVRRFEFSGNTIFSSKSLATLLNDYANTVLYPEDLVNIRRLITDKYVTSGYVSSGALLEGWDGDSYQIRIVEGELTSLDVNSNGRLRDSYLEARVTRRVDSPLNMESLQLAITHLERDPRIDFVKGKLKPGENPGESNLYLDVFEANPFSVKVHTNNYLPPSIGNVQLVAEIKHLNLSGRGDSMSITLSNAEGSSGASIRYIYPRPDIGWELEFMYSYADSLVVEEPFDRINITSDTRVSRFAAMRELTVSNRVSWSFGFSIEEKSSKSFLFDEPFDFTFGSRNGKSNASVIALINEFQLSSHKQAFVMRNEFRKGVGWLFAAKPQPGFRMLLTQLQYSRRLENSWLLILGSDIQLSRDSLKSFERYPLGGRSSVRGYRENQLLRDNAVDMSAELNMPIITGLTTEFSISIFTDYGRAWNSETFSGQDKYETLSSIGVGLKYQSQRGLSFRFEWAKRLQEKNQEGSKLQDDGIHLGFSYEF
jgi:hemolysin activation/secretion protein